MSLSLPLAVDARERADRIRSGLESIEPLVRAAWEQRDWEALGYGTWHEYVVGEFGGPLRLGRAERREAVVDLREAGMSTRAIGAALGVDHRTVGHDLESPGEYSPPAPVTGLDGKTYSPVQPAQPAQPARSRLEVLVSGAMSALIELMDHDVAEVDPLITNQRSAFAVRARAAGDYLHRLSDSIGGSQ